MRKPPAQPESVTPAPAPGAVVGLVVRLDGGLLKRLKGRVITFDHNDVVLAVPEGIVNTDEVPLEKFDVPTTDGGPRAAVNFIKVPLGDTTADYARWGTKIPHLDAVETRTLMQMFCSSTGIQPIETATESMYSLTDRDDLQKKLKDKDAELDRLRTELQQQAPGKSGAAKKRSMNGPGDLSDVLRAGVEGPARRSDSTMKGRAASGSAGTHM